MREALTFSESRQASVHQGAGVPEKINRQILVQMSMVRARLLVGAVGVRTDSYAKSS